MADPAGMAALGSELAYVALIAIDAFPPFSPRRWHPEHIAVGDAPERLRPWVDRRKEIIRRL
jgi:hypothetical protein